MISFSICLSCFSAHSGIIEKRKKNCQKLVETVYKGQSDLVCRYIQGGCQNFHTVYTGDIYSVCFHFAGFKNSKTKVL